MKILGDYHTHTVYSHGSGTVEDNALAAKNKNLLQLGITDHGFSHPFYGVRKDRLSALREDCMRAEQKTGVRVLMGLESNFIKSDGLCDLTEDLYGKFDIFLAGAHVFATYKDFASFWNIGFISPVVSGFKGELKGPAKAYMTNVYIKAVRTQPIDVITHLNYRVFADVKEVAHCCREYGTYIEINTKKTHMTDDEWREVISTGVNFVIGSDAHSPDRVSDADPAFSLIDRLGIPLERVHNVGRLPDFRFAAYKGVKL